jgi:hypothetical protein
MAKPARKPAPHTPASPPIETTAVEVPARPAPGHVPAEPAELAAPAAPDRRERLAAALRAAVLIAEPSELDTLEQWAAGAARRELDGTATVPPPAAEKKGPPLVVIVGLGAAAGYLLTRPRRGRR